VKLISTTICVPVVLITASCLLVQSCQEDQSLPKLLASIPDRPELALTVGQASGFAALSLACLDKEYPNKPGNILDGLDTLQPPAVLTPTFYGCFDWHSAVHGHWALVRLLKTFPDIPEAAIIRKKLDRHLSAEALEKELAYLNMERNKTFERPYGWGWLLRLSAELATFDDAEARRWKHNLVPLAHLLSRRSINYLRTLSVPIRAGTHPNTAFAMMHMLDYARIVGDAELEKTINKRAKDFYLHDRNCPTDYEPSGEDFISPCLAEADLMRRVLPTNEFVSWLGKFLPPLASERFKPLLEPAEVRDLNDPKIVHLIGLALQRAWCFQGIARSLPVEDPRKPVLLKLARLHRAAAVRQMFDSDYGGKHWLASFAIFLLTDADFSASS
jgi:hypothetical protein